MSQTATIELMQRPECSYVPDHTEFEDASPFGLQGLDRDLLQILKPECVTRLAITLALRATRAQILDDDYINRVISWHPDWVEEYRIVHLIEKSLWIQGHSDLVMTMTRNPSQIPDNPPPKIKQALSRAYVLHPEATIWYGVPLFGTETNEDGLPLPVSAAAVRAEARRRIEAARDHALRWGWMYRAGMKFVRIPSVCWHYGVAVRNRVRQTRQRMFDYWNKCRQDARRRARAICLAENQRCRFGSSQIAIPEHRTLLGRSLETACLLTEVVAYQASVAGSASPFMALVAAPLAIAKFAPFIFVPITVVSMDPFLFVELPEEPGKLRHVGHWYWQTNSEGRQKLHLHV